jgi:REP element-mobilizing transposase RayT
MTYDPKIHHRRSIRLKGYDYTSPGAYFVTVCVEDGECVLGDVIDGEMELSAWGEIVAECWQEIPDHFPHAALDAFVVMPNHVHGIIVITEAPTPRPGVPDGTPDVGATHASPLPRGPVPGSIGAIVGSFKSGATKQINEHRALPGGQVWQRNYYDHIIRDPASLDRLREYIATNPARWELDQLHPDAPPNRFNPARPVARREP